MEQTAVAQEVSMLSGVGFLKSCIHPRKMHTVLAVKNCLD